MVGLRRLDDLQACVEQVVADGVEGDLIEAGAWRGGASIVMRATLDTLGDDAHRLRGRLVPGLPRRGRGRRGAPAQRVRLPRRAAWRRSGRTSCASASTTASSSSPGFFEETLPPLAGRRGRSSASTATPTRRPGSRSTCLYPGLAVGGHLILDDYGSFEGCRRAVDEFRLAPRDRGAARARSTATGVRWRRSTTAGPSTDRAVPEPRTARARARPEQPRGADRARARARRRAGRRARRAGRRDRGARSPRVRDLARSARMAPGQEARRDDRVRQLDHRPGGLRRARRPGSAAPRSPTRR